MHICENTDPPVGFFEVQFVGVKKSAYRNEFSFRSGMSQEQILAYDWEDRDRMYEVRDNIATSPDIQFQLKIPWNMGIISTPLPMMVSMIVYICITVPIISCVI